MTDMLLPRRGVAELLELETCASTQDAARELLGRAETGAIVAVSAQRQSAGRGRQGRSWSAGSGSQLLLSVAVDRPGNIALLDSLPRRVVDGVHRVIAQDIPAAARELEWKPPNDLVASTDGAKIGGVLIDSASTGDRVDRVIVGIGINLDGAPFVLGDGRRATSVAACCGEAPARDGLVRLIAEHVAWLIVDATRARP